MKAYEPLYNISRIYKNLISGTHFSRGGNNFALRVPRLRVVNIMIMPKMMSKLFKGVPFNMKELITNHSLNILVYTVNFSLFGSEWPKFMDLGGGPAGGMYEVPCVCLIQSVFVFLYISEI